MVLFDTILSDPNFDRLAAALAPDTGAVHADGLWGSAAPILAAVAAQRLNRPLLLVTAHSDEADDARDDVETAVGRTPELLPQVESLPGEPEDEELAGERLRLCIALRRPATPSDPPPLIVAPIQALMHPVPTPAAIDSRSRTVLRGQSISPDELAGWLAQRGFTACDAVEAPGDFARRGGIVDVFCTAHSNPVRIEFFGDEVESIRLFDAASQRSRQELQEVLIPALLSASAPSESETTGFLALLDPRTLVAFVEPVEMQELARAHWQRIGERVGLIPPEAIFRSASRLRRLFLSRFGSGGSDAIRFDAGALPQFDARVPDAMRALREVAATCAVAVYCDNAPEAERFTELLREQSEPMGAIETRVGVLHRGFRWGRRAFVPNHEIFGRYRQRRTLRRIAPARPIDSFFDLSAGDPVVHVLHGIGRFLGLRSMERNGRTEEFLALEFADGVVVNVATSQIHLVQKYVGSLRGRMVLSKVGGTAWKKTRDRVADALLDMAGELLRIQADRETESGTAFPADTHWQREFEGSFLYEETPDQLRAIAEIKADMSRPRPMDRLLCGDVGFGKTELAMRAAFKVCEFGRQVAVLVPTTVLAEQHYHTFRERMAEYPFSVECLSRFRSAAEQKKIVDRARKGQVDVLIGTHRLLSADVRFADLGLVVIDEEQRFGVNAKERLKRLRSTVDVLSLSATPIPRTLHMSMLGIRDISSLSTPPADRRAIVTQVRTWDDQTVREALERELSREGQAYVVHNFVRDIEQVANRVRSLVPEARVVVGHGQMSGDELEQVMLRFVRHEADILVSTNIIESGLDVARANTMIISRADRFGLADLHQLRGRVGRSRHRAYCYLMLAPGTPVTDRAARRLKAIEHYSDLGAGFQIAMRDLEIRGAGNILGPEQSGHIEAVGYEMYCELLEQAVRRVKNEPAEPFRPVNLELGVSATIPRVYVRGEKQRMEVYKRLTICRTVEDIAALRDDLRDAYGPLPEEVETLLTMAEIRVRARAYSVRSIVLSPPDLVFSVDELTRAERLFAHGPGSPRMPDPRTIHWRLPARLLAPPETLLRVLRDQLAGTGASPSETPAAFTEPRAQLRAPGSSLSRPPAMTIAPNPPALPE